jgi:NDP-sugar pyrophosphorylase family protein
VTRAPLRGGIIAAGDGSRLRADGFSMPKPLVPVAGVPLIERTLRNLIEVGVTVPVVIVNEQSRACVDWVRQRFPGQDVEFIVKTTRSSLESFLEVSRRLSPGRALISTVDAWCPATELEKFVDAARRRPAEASVIAVTPLVHDEKPLWVEADESGAVQSLGRASSARPLVTAGIYMLSEAALAKTPPPLARLRDFLMWLHRDGEPMYAETIEAVIDVDRASDVALAEAAEAREAGKPTRL